MFAGVGRSYTSDTERATGTRAVSVVSGAVSSLPLVDADMAGHEDNLWHHRYN